MKKSKFREYTEALLTALLVALVLRSFVIEAFKVPSASMVPSILIGDHLFVNKFAYGLRLPLTKTWMTRFDDPERGEIAVFIYPLDEGKDFIKRVVGLPGDHIKMAGRQLFVNGQAVPAVPAQATPQGDVLQIRTADQAEPVMETDIFPDWRHYDFYLETLGERTHLVQYHRQAAPIAFEVSVPDGHLFMMGDNRNRSSDSRDWGFVPIDNLKGRAMFVWLSLDKTQARSLLDFFLNIDDTIRWGRIGHWLE